ncbi:MAG: precorrin-4 C(11)-methyltransferase [Methanomicrobiales archaeon]|nr:precorrin-4 C(11)-methyltransferase [Methanomicrobiales archaeon]
MKTVYFVGAGPGDADLITVKGRRLLEQADVLIYAGSLVCPDLVRISPAAVKRSSHGMHLQELVDMMAGAVREGKNVVRLHSGDPSLYGAIVEQVLALQEQGIPVKIVPGVSSMFAAAAALGTQLTLRGVSETLIVTRPAGTTLQEDHLRELSRHGATMVVFLGTGHLEEIVQQVAYPRDTPAAVVYHASWDDEKIACAPLGKIAETARSLGIEKTALLIIGRVVEPRTAGFVHSELYR